jgi:ubiquinone/menaquinone biosynthesis C-methylase UbiE
VDLSFNFLKWYFRPTVLADAQYLPFKNGCFKVVKSSHVLEHLKNPSKAIDEMLRVATKEIIIRFPTEWDVLPLFITHLLPIPRFSALKMSCQTRKNRLHLWIIAPELVMNHLRDKGWASSCRTNTYSMFAFFEGGRKADHFKWLTKHFRIPFDYAILAKKRSQSD